MKRRQLKQIVSMLLAVVMAVGLLPTTAFAVDPPDISDIRGMRFQKTHRGIHISGEAAAHWEMG